MKKIPFDEMKQIMDKSEAHGCTFIIVGNDRKKLTKDDYANIKLLLKAYVNIKYVCTKQKDKTFLHVSTDTRKDEFELFGPRNGNPYIEAERVHPDSRRLY